MADRGITDLVCRHKVADEQEDAHDDMFGDRDDIRPGDLEHLDALLDRRVQVDVVGANAGRDTDLQVLGLDNSIYRMNFGAMNYKGGTHLFDEFASEVSGVEGRGDENLGLSMYELAPTRTFKLKVDNARRRCSSGRQTRGPPCRL